MGVYEDLESERKLVSYFMRRLYAKGLTTCSGGNISLRVGEDLVLVTPSALDKGELQADEVVLVRMDGENLTPKYKPTIEAGMHLEVLRRRPEMMAVVHAHPAFATAFACMDEELDITLSSEVFCMVDIIAQAGFAPPGTEELAGIVGEAMGGADVALMHNHGVITVGATLLKAFDLIEVVEVTAKMNLIIRMMGGKRRLTDGQKRACNVIFRPDSL